MKFSLKVDVPQALRPFFPYYLEEDLPTRLTIKNDPVKKLDVYWPLGVAIVHTFYTIVYPSLFQYCVIFFFYSFFVLGFFADEPDEIVVSSLGIIQVRRFLFYPFRRLLPRERFQSIRYTVTMENAERHTGHVILYRANHREYRMLYLKRAMRNQLVEDLTAISAKLSSVLGIPNKPKEPLKPPPRQRLPSS
jgi:hypothetical protein